MNHNHTQVKRILDTVRGACKDQNVPHNSVSDAFNQSTQDGRDMDAYSQLLDQAIASMIEVKEEGDIDSLFTSDKTSALVDTIQGLDDFELISFLVIQG